ncbi:fimbrillin family protein [Bacteroides sp. 519]|uniref:fimbrillin family protein n=1 Tax=Bacteroides sp. 519 TaxID=2302937 RepID=UPI0013CF8894|nr:fimbrillin family protein [Bacteroides sp. 519]NDV56899.1 hypothetical protein [Bacteroides sp. 519]
MMLQKKSLCALFIGVALLSACSSDEIEDTTNCIRFDLNIEGQLEAETRGKPANGTTTANYRSQSFNMLAVQYEGNTSAPLASAFDKATVAVNASGSHIANNSYKKNWPDYNLTFYAMSPSSAGMLPSTTTVPTGASPTYQAGTHTIGTTFGTQADLLWARTGSVGPGTNGEVTLTFNHILSRITFQAIKTCDDVVTIKKISILQAYNKAKGRFTNSAFTWYDFSDRQDFAMNFTTPVTIAKATNFTGVQYLRLGTDTYNPDANDNSMFMFPINTATGNLNNVFGTTVKLEIEYTLGGVPKKHTENISGLTSTHNWAMGAWTNYQITINAKYITFTPITVLGWGAAINVPVTVN